jgi:hypothetical protein|tara:strand:- start:836 stop:967 length:132 start_codon:yes stop_codon:yes gene_type:complete
MAETYSRGPENKKKDESDVEKPPVDIVVSECTMASNHVIPNAL